MTENNKTEIIHEIKSMIHGFCKKYLNDELEGYSLKLCDKLGRMRKINIIRGKKEIWAACIIYVIARLNFLFDKENEYFITSDTICEFFSTKKSTIGNKATQIEKTCKLGLGAEGYCSKHITDSLTFVQTPEDFILLKSKLENRELVIEFVEGEEAEELEKFMEKRRRIEEQKAHERKAKRTEINRKIAENKKKKKKEDDPQLSLFDDF